jgi:hypothetical protein
MRFAIQKNIKIYFQGNIKQKQLVKISKIPGQYQEGMKAELIVQINTDYYEDFMNHNDLDNINQILFDQEIDRIHVDKNEKITLKSLGLRASRGIIDKFSYDDVSRAEEIENLYEEQKKEVQ